MSIFWKYFRETLRWPLIWKPGPISALVEGASRVLDDVRDDILWLRSQFKPEICDAENVIRFARSRGIKRHSLETDGGKFKSRVVNAYAWQMLGGRTEGLPQIFSHYGYQCDKVINLRVEDPERWGEFSIEVAPAEGEGFVEEDYELIPYIANDQKPARSKIDQIIMHVDSRGAHPAMKNGIQTGEMITVYPWAETEVEVSSPLYAAMCMQAVETITVLPGEV